MSNKNQILALIEIAAQSAERDLNEEAIYLMERASALLESECSGYFITVNGIDYDVTDVVESYKNHMKNYAGNSSPMVFAIKAIRSRTGASLREAKQYMDQFRVDYPTQED